MTHPSGQVSALRKYRTLFVIIALPILVGLWWLFRPERLFINQQVNEAAPAGVADLQPVFTGSFHAATPGGANIHGRVNVLKDGSKLRLQFTNLESTTTKSFTVALAPGVSSSAGAKTLGDITVAAPKMLDVPAGVNPATDKTVLLMKSNQIIATATLEAF